MREAEVFTAETRRNPDIPLPFLSKNQRKNLALL